MGAVCCIQEDVDSPGTSSKIELDEKQSSAPVTAAGSAAGMVDQLRGHWTRKEDNMSLGTISGNNMVWETVYKHMPSPIWEVHGDRVKMNLAGEEHFGKVTLSGTATITWEDGEVWVRK
ncbi:unnamed protein product [Effrenium voratum]|uniref:Uncharacterized protein n=1 Tax=Effrenium voratum TaxID=2562239 RepID=A0AA36HQ14_9DINO|nr:unnamed protein product [Effrenium voratum]CAJ1372921.1 unnamed protein product [Effrenium voratum]CAJ1419168.1 unnamed protein product [Effrenium voratum]